MVKKDKDEALKLNIHALSKTLSILKSFDREKAITLAESFDKSAKEALSKVLSQ